MTKDQFAEFVTRAGIAGVRIDEAAALYLWSQFKTTDETVWQQAVNQVFGGEVVPRNIEAALKNRIAEIRNASHKREEKFPAVPTIAQENIRRYTKLIAMVMSRPWDLGAVNEAMMADIPPEELRDILEKELSACIEHCRN